MVLTVGRPYYRMKDQLLHGLHPRRRQLATRGHKDGRYVMDGSRPISSQAARLKRPLYYWMWGVHGPQL